ncbi:MAG: hypothetical protein HYU56_00760 [Candidatus Aenigmarchaeota archaeon]|nr:hypothetical protein [Candidatus Aenigmarchaeota archaeon]
MIIIKHRVNTVKDLKETPEEFGVEVDIRTWGKDLILHHDPFVEGEKLEDFLSNYNHKFIILESKVERIENRVIDLAKQYGIKDYFLLSVNPPFMWKLMNENFKKMNVRFSELESAETCLLWKDKVDWVWVDTWTKLPLDRKSYDILKKHFKICLVSPEILNRPQDIAKYRKFFSDNKMEIDAACTDDCEAWK